MFLLAHWEKDSVFSLSSCDGAVMGHHGWRDVDICNYILSRPGWMLFDYFNVWQMPLPKWCDGSNPWFEYLGPEACYRTPDGRPIVERFKGRRIIPWAELDPQEAAATILACKEARNPLGHGGIFGDCWWPWLRGWMSDDIKNMDPAVHAAHAANLNEATRILESSATPIMSNGERTIIRVPVYLEDVGQRIPWAEAAGRWDGLNVLSVNADNPFNVVYALSQWLPGKWLAFTGEDPEAVARAYGWAIEHRRTYVPR
jgi:hypothetical protein